MAERAGSEVETLTLRIPMRLQRRGGRKLIMTPEGSAVPAPPPGRDDIDQGPGARAPLARQDRERAGAVDHRSCAAGGVTV